MAKIINPETAIALQFLAYITFSIEKVLQAKNF